MIEATTYDVLCALCCVCIDVFLMMMMIDIDKKTKDTSPTFANKPHHD